MTAVTAQTGQAVLELAGELTIQTAAEQKVRRLAALESAAALHLDLAGVTELDSAGLQLLLMLRREAAQSGRALRLVGHPQPVLEVLALANLSPELADLSGTGTADPTEEPSR